MAVSTLSSKGQITIPIEVRKRLGLHQGDRVEFHLESDGSVSLRPMGRRAAELYGFLARPHSGALSVEEMDDSLADAVAEEDWGKDYR